MENITYANNVLTPGYRFYPTEEELVKFYLRNKLEGKRVDDIQRVIPVINIYQYNPSQLPEGLCLSKTTSLSSQNREMAGEVIKHDSEQWFFFIPIQDREARGGRPTRLTTHGYWKATGTPGYVYSSSNNRIIGGKRTMVFYKGRAPNGKKTQWKMNEYKATTDDDGKLRHEFSLCRVYKKSKCVRAFDRRPAGSGLLLLTPHQPLINNVDHNQAEPSNNHNNNNNNNNIIGTSSSSGEHCGYNYQNNSQPVGNFNDLSETPLWDFDDWNFIYMYN